MLKRLMASNNSVIIDGLCMAPGVQQVVGISGGLVDLISLVGTLADRAFKEIKNLRENTPRMKTTRIISEMRIRRHLTSLAINTIRAIPLVGSVFSFMRLQWGISARQRGM